jgi:hypothetical protein
VDPTGRGGMVDEPITKRGKKKSGWRFDKEECVHHRL